MERDASKQLTTISPLVVYIKYIGVVFINVSECLGIEYLCLFVYLHLHLSQTIALFSTQQPRT